LQKETKKPRAPIAIISILIAALIAVTGCSAKLPIIATDAKHSLTLDADGKLYATGQNDKGQLGLVGIKYRHTFALIESLENKNIVAVAVGAQHSLALSADGKVYATGRNDSGQLGLGESGLGDKFNRNTFTPAQSLEGKKIVAIAAGQFCSLALDELGKIYGTGRNLGQLGLGHYGALDTFTPARSLENKKIVAIAADNEHSLALDDEGKTYATGWNRDGQLGLGDTKNRNTFTLVESLGGRKIVAITGGFAHSLALDSDGKVYAAGWNKYGQLGLSDETSRSAFTLVSSLADKKIVAIAASYQHSLAIDNNGAVYATGWNDFGQLGLGDKFNRNTFTRVSSLEGKKIVAIAAGAIHFFVVDSEGNIYATGDNEYDQLGLGGSSDEKTFKPVVLPDQN
jgi:alpha-tubulin suppressor-like RCC1 family protein